MSSNEPQRQLATKCAFFNCSALAALEAELLRHRGASRIEARNRLSDKRASAIDSFDTRFEGTHCIANAMIVSGAGRVECLDCHRIRRTARANCSDVDLIARVGGSWRRHRRGRRNRRRRRHRRRRHSRTNAAAVQIQVRHIERIASRFLELHCLVFHCALATNVVNALRIRLQALCDNWILICFLVLNWF